MIHYCSHELSYYSIYYQNVYFPVLVERLEKEYGLDHPVVSFRDSQFRIFNSTVNRHKIGDLYKPEVQKTITGLTTFYLPPKELRPNDLDMAKRLGLRIAPTAKPLSGPFQVDRPYSDRDKAAVKALDTHALPNNYKRLRASRPMATAMQQLAIDPKSRDLFQKAPAAFVATHPDLRPSERSALESSKTWVIHSAMKATPAAVADEFVQACLRNPTLSQQWSTILKRYKDQDDGADQIAAWLKSQGYDTTLDEVDKAWARELGQGLDVYSTTYNTLLDNKAGPLLVISKGTVTFDSVKIKKFTFAESVLSWSQSDGNASTVKVTLVILTDNDGKPLPPDSYIGPMLSGTLTDINHPSEVKLYGRVGDFPKPSDPSDPDPGPTDGTKLEQYDSTYATYSKSGSSWVEDVELAVEAPNVTYNGKALTNVKFANSILSVSTIDGNPVNLSLYFYYSTSNKTPGNQFYGRRWGVGESPPSDANFMGLIGQSTNPSGQANSASWLSILKTAALNTAQAVIGMVLGHYVIKALSAKEKANETGAEEDEKAYEEAKEEADNAADAEERVAEENIEGNPSAEDVGPDPGPGPQVRFDMIIIGIIYLCLAT